MTMYWRRCSTQITRPIPEQSDSVAEIGDRITTIIAEQTDIADYLGRALIDGSPLGVHRSSTRWWIPALPGGINAVNAAKPARIST